MSSKLLPAKSHKEKRDASIIGTNDYSIVSKRSVESLYYKDEPQFLSTFVPKLRRRAPLVNRGYWLRVQAIEQIVRHFITHNTTKRKVVVNLGCGYDVLPFQFLHRYKQSCEDTIFVDVDYPQLIETKVSVIRDHDLFLNCLSNIEQIREKSVPINDPATESGTGSANGAEPHCATDTNDRTQLKDDEDTENGPRKATKRERKSKKDKSKRPSAKLAFKSKEYMAVGCDLHNLPALDQLLRKEIPVDSYSILFFAEVSIAYMDISAADSVISWASTFPDAQFCLLEQYLPDGADHPFASTMLEHFAKQTPLKVLYAYPQLFDQTQRFLRRGWHSALARSLWSLWQENGFLDANARHEVEKVEPFDEWEEFALFSGHYFVLWASTLATSERPNWMEIELASTQQYTNNNPPSTADVVGQKLSKDHIRHRFAASFTTDQNNIVCHGGTAPSLRHQTSIVYCTLNPSDESTARIGPPLELTCHTITAVEGKGHLLVGGRKSFLEFNQSCWLRQDGNWIQVGDLSPGRIRHCATAVNYPNPGVLIYGGKSSAGEILDQCRYWSLAHGWQGVHAVSPHPPARFGAAMACINGPRGRNGLIIGGIGADGVVLGDIWEWELEAPSDAAGGGPGSSPPSIRFTDRSPSLSGAIIPRFGSTIVQTRPGLLLIGGVAAEAPLRRGHEMMLLTCENGAGGLSATPVCPSYQGERPLLVGFCAANLDSDQVLVLGGGAVCFSFGAYWNGSLWTIGWPMSRQVYLRLRSGMDSEDKGARRAWSRTDDRSQAFVGSEGCSVGIRSQETVKAPIETTQDFEKLISSGSPAIINGLPLGRCLESWTSDYLKEAVGRERSVVIHTSDSEALSFQEKNFSYVTLPFGQFIEQAMHGKHVYLRALSATQPSKISADFWQDFPSLADDFSLPAPLKFSKDHEHSSVLRVSGCIRMWLHYDVMANVYCQIRGKKRIRLFTPSDVRLLKFTAGETTSEIDVFDSASEAALQGTHPFDAVLGPGDILFIPACWPHATAPVTDEDSGNGGTNSKEGGNKNGYTSRGMSVAVNVFFRSLGRGYAAGRDVYGNRDLEAYQNGRRDIARILQQLQAQEQNLDVRKALNELADILLGARKLKHVDTQLGSKEIARIVRSVEGLDSCIAQFYRDRLAQELLDKASALQANSG